MFKKLRPAGNPVKLQRTNLDLEQFAPFQFDFYQSGTAALAATILACINLKSESTNRPEVILPAYCCPDLLSAILYAGATPILVDLDPNSPRMSLTQIENAISANTTALLAVRFLGIPERIDELLNICRRHQIMLIEDSAQGFPLTEPNTYWRGDFTVLSFGRGKPVSLLAGGAVVTKQHKLRALLPKPAPPDISLLASAKYLAKMQLYNLLINPVAYGLVSIIPGLNIGASIYKPLHKIIGMPDFVKARLNTNIESYKRCRLVGKVLRDNLKKLNAPDMTDIASSINFDYSNPLLRYPLLVKDQVTRDHLHDVLSPFGASKMYQLPIYQIESVPHVFSSELIKSLPNSMSFANRLITLPTHQGVTCEILAEINRHLSKVM